MTNDTPGRGPILDQLAGWSTGADPVPEELGGGFHAAIADHVIGARIVLPGWHPSFKAAIAAAAALATDGGRT